MFWKKKKIYKKEESLTHLVVIPDIFYGGADPLIYSEQKPKREDPNREKKSKAPKQKTEPLLSKKKLILIIFIISIVVVGISWYYVRQASLQKETPLEQQPKPQLPKETKPPQVTPPKTTTTEEVIPPVEPVPSVTSTLFRPLSFPRILLKDSSDIDKDFLTDLEEEIFNTDSGIWDTDEDGYYDGQEVFNLYNPTGFAPVKLIDSGLVREYVNPTWQYRVYYPIGWEAASVDSANDHVLFSSITGDFIEIRAIKNDLSSPFSAWFSQNITGQRFADLSNFNNRFDIEGIKRKDNLVTYFVADKMVFIMIYQPAGDALNVPFRHVMQVMYQSFRPSEVFVNIPDQSILPPAP